MNVPIRTMLAHRPAFHQAFRQRFQRSLHVSRPLLQQYQEERSDPKAHRNFWKSHGRAIFKALTLAFFSYQLFYWTWITIEAEQMKDEKNYQIQSLKGEVRLLDDGRRSHRPAEAVVDGAKRLLEEEKKS